MALPPPLPPPTLVEGLVADHLATLSEKCAYVGQDIPARILEGASRGYGAELRPSEVLYALYDSTVRENGENGFSITNERTVGRELWSKPFAFEHGDVMGGFEREPHVVVPLKRAAVMDEKTLLVHDASARRMFASFYAALGAHNGGLTPFTDDEGIGLRQALGVLHAAAMEGALTDEIAWELFDIVMTARASRNA